MINLAEPDDCKQGELLAQHRQNFKNQVDLQKMRRWSSCLSCIFFMYHLISPPFFNLLLQSSPPSLRFFKLCNFTFSLSFSCCTSHHTVSSRKTIFLAFYQSPPSRSETIFSSELLYEPGVSSEFSVCSSLKLGDGRVISLPIGSCCRLNCVFVPINLIKGLIAFANQPVSSCCCLLLPLISEITGPLLEHKAPDNNTVTVGGGGVHLCLWFWTDMNFPPRTEDVNVFLYLGFLHPVMGTDWL